MREVVATLAGREVRLAATFGAAQELADRVADPLAIAREANLEAMMLASRLPYDPKFAFTVRNLPVILHIGMRAADKTVKIEDVQALIFDAGFSAAREVAVEYLGAIIGPQPEETPEATGETKPGE